MADAGENAGIGNLVAVQVEYRQNRSVGCRVEKLVGMPTRGHGAGLCFAVADDTGNDQIGVIEGRSVGVREGVTELAAFVKIGRASCRERVELGAVGAEYRAEIERRERLS